jgi:tetratricopeptide (TPR) repeat protein
VADWKRLGDALATMGDFKEASNSFRQALELEPNNPSHYTNLAKSLEYQGRYDEAISVVRKHMMLIEPYGEKEGIANLRSHVELLRLKRARPADE